MAPNILVETYHEGRSVQEVVNENRSPVLDHKLAELGSATFFEMILIHNLLHADLHPGNILVELGPADGLISRFAGSLCNSLKHLGKGMDKDSFIVRLGEWCTRAAKKGLGQEYHIVLLDAGMAAQLSDAERKLMIDLFRAFANMDGPAAADATLKFAGGVYSLGCFAISLVSCSLPAAEELLYAEKNNWEARQKLCIINAAIIKVLCILQISST